MHVSKSTVYKICSGMKNFAKFSRTIKDFSQPTGPVVLYIDWCRKHKSLLTCLLSINRRSKMVYSNTRLLVFPSTAYLLSTLVLEPNSQENQELTQIPRSFVIKCSVKQISMHYIFYNHNINSVGCFYRHLKYRFYFVDNIYFKV